MKLLLLSGYFGVLLLFGAGCASEGSKSDSRFGGRAGIAVSSQNMSPFTGAHPRGPVPQP